MAMFRFKNTMIFLNSAAEADKLTPRLIVSPARKLQARGRYCTTDLMVKTLTV